MPALVPADPTVPRPANHPSASLESAIALTRPVNLARDHLLPVLPALRGLLPTGGLRRGITVAVDAEGEGAMSLALALAAGPSLAGSWVVVVGIPTLGLVAAAAAGLALERLAIVREPPLERWATVVAALVDAVDVVMVGPPPGRGGCAADARRLSARVRERGAVLVEVGEPTTTPPPRRSVDLRFTVTDTRWEGLGVGYGHLRARRTTVEVDGRREASRRRRGELWLPGPDGRPAPIVDEHVEGEHVDGTRIVRSPGFTEARVG